MPLASFYTPLKRNCWNVYSKITAWYTFISELLIFFFENNLSSNLIPGYWYILSNFPQKQSPRSGLWIASPKDFAKLTRKCLRWSFFFSSVVKRDSMAVLFLWIMRNLSELLLCQIPVNGCSCFSAPANEFSWSLRIWTNFTDLLKILWGLRTILTNKSLSLHFYSYDTQVEWKLV